MSGVNNTKWRDRSNVFDVCCKRVSKWLNDWMNDWINKYIN